MSRNEQPAYYVEPARSFGRPTYSGVVDISVDARALEHWNINQRKAQMEAVARSACRARDSGENGRLPSPCISVRSIFENTCSNHQNQTRVREASG